MLLELIRGKVKLTMLRKKTLAGVHLHLPGLEPVRGEPLMSVTHGQCDARPTVTFAACKVSPPIGWYQVIQLVDRGTCVLTTSPGLHSTAGRLGFEPATY